jgi:hypothetical protein
MTVHANSLAAYRSLNISDRAAAVLHTYVEAIQPITDRECMQRMGFFDPNQVRPRVTELIAAAAPPDSG